MHRVDVPKAPRGVEHVVGPQKVEVKGQETAGEGEASAEAVSRFCNRGGGGGLGARAFGSLDDKAPDEPHR